MTIPPGFAPILLFCWTGFATAAPLYYESFDYLPALDGLAGHGGFDGGSPDGVGVDIVAGSLSYQDSQGNTLVTSGNHAFADAAAEGATISQLAPLDLTRAAGNTLWFSLIGQQTSGTNARFFNVSFFAPDNTLTPADADTKEEEIFAIGMPSNQEPQNRWRVVDRALLGAWNSGISTTATTDKVFAVVRVDLDATGPNDRYTLWINPRLDQVPADADGFTFLSSTSDFNQWGDLQKIRIGAGGPNASGPGSEWLVDEIRIGDTYTDVAPWLPGSLPQFVIDSVTRQPGNALTLSWRMEPDWRYTVEECGDFTTWTPVDGAVFGSGSPAVQTWTSPVPAVGDSGRFYRLRRSPAVLPPP